MATNLAGQPASPWSSSTHRAASILRRAAGVLACLPLRHNTRAYALTDRGLALREAIVALGRWGAEEA